jgi:hypothetical protein
VKNDTFDRYRTRRTHAPDRGGEVLERVSRARRAHGDLLEEDGRQTAVRHDRGGGVRVRVEPAAGEIVHRALARRERGLELVG